MHRSGGAAPRYRGQRFQSPSRWGWCCIGCSEFEPCVAEWFQSPSRWGWCCIPRTHRRTAADRSFQSPSRWGWCCIDHGQLNDAPSSCFSPLLDGDGVASLIGSPVRTIRRLVSVPFSMGTVLHPRSSREGARFRVSFSPLLDGDGVASTWVFCLQLDYVAFQSPSRWGRCCIFQRSNRCGVGIFVSVPFSMGTVLHPPAPASK